MPHGSWLIRIAEGRGRARGHCALQCGEELFELRRLRWALDPLNCDVNVPLVTPLKSRYMAYAAAVGDCARK